MNRKEIVERQQAILDAAKREGRELTAEETREFASSEMLQQMQSFFALVFLCRSQQTAQPR